MLLLLIMMMMMFVSGVWLVRVGRRGRGVGEGVGRERVG